MSISHRQELSCLCIYLYIATRGRIIRGCVFFFSPYGLSDKASACTISMWFILQRFQKPPILHSYRESESRIFYQWLGFEIEIHLLNKNLLLLNLFWNVMFYILLSKSFFICWVNPPPLLLRSIYMKYLIHALKMNQCLTFKKKSVLHYLIFCFNQYLIMLILKKNIIENIDLYVSW